MAQLDAIEARVRGEVERRAKRRRLYSLYPDEGPLRRALYPRHLEFFAAGARHAERAFIGGNRTGKTFCAGYELSCHLIGFYPAWWVGRTFSRPIVAWVAGEDAKAVRESLQPTLMGTEEEGRGTGLIPGDHILKAPPRSGTSDALDFALIRHQSGGRSRLVFKSYDQRRGSFESARVDVVLFDEEPPLPIYSAGLTRTMSTVPGEPSGIVMCAFTPLKGVSDTVLQFLPGGALPASAELRMQAWGW